jgi:hypothetical protein
MLNCKTVTHLLSEAQERELGVKERMQLALHLSMCSGCRNYKKQIGFLRTAARRHPAGAAGTDEIKYSFEIDGRENPDLAVAQGEVASGAGTVDTGAGRLRAHR